MSEILAISDLPEADSILETDTFYIISQRDDSYIKQEVTFNDLSVFFYTKDIVEKLADKYKELLQLSANFLNFISETYPTSEYLSSHYTKIETFNNIFKSVENIYTVSSYLDEYATIDYELYAKLNAKAECEKELTEYQKDTGADVMLNMETSPEM